MRIQFKIEGQLEDNNRIFLVALRRRRDDLSANIFGQRSELHVQTSKHFYSPKCAMAALRTDRIQIGLPHLPQRNTGAL